MRINPINTNVLGNYSNLSKCRKPCGVSNSTLSYQDTFEKSDKDDFGPKQNLSFGLIYLFQGRRIKQAIGEKYYRPLAQSEYFEIEYKKNFPGMVHVAHVHPEKLDMKNHSKEIKKIQKTFIENHSDRFKMENFTRIGFVCHGEKDLIMISTLAKKLLPYEIKPEVPPYEESLFERGYAE